jgi:hypothetical protein
MKPIKSLRQRVLFVLVFTVCVSVANLAGRMIDGIDRRSPDFIPLSAGFDTVPVLLAGVSALNFISIGYVERGQHRKYLYLTGRGGTAGYGRSGLVDLALSVSVLALLVAFSRWLVRKIMPD